MSIRPMPADWGEEAHAGVQDAFYRLREDTSLVVRANLDTFECLAYKQADRPVCHIQFTPWVLQLTTLSDTCLLQFGPIRSENLTNVSRLMFVNSFFFWENFVLYADHRQPARLPIGEYENAPRQTTRMCLVACYEETCCVAFLSCWFLDRSKRPSKRELKYPK